MKLKTFNLRNCGGRAKTKGARITVSKNGYIAFNRLAQETIGLDANSKTEGGILIMQDEERPTDWYVCCSESPNAIRLHVSSNKSGWGRFMSKSLSNMILSSLELDQTITFPLAKEPVGGNIYAILTHAKQ
jgi:hypothetical protein